MIGYGTCVVGVRERYVYRYMWEVIWRCTMGIGGKEVFEIGTEKCIGKCGMRRYGIALKNTYRYGRGETDTDLE